MPVFILLLPPNGCKCVAAHVLTATCEASGLMTIRNDIVRADTIKRAARSK